VVASVDGQHGGRRQGHGDGDVGLMDRLGLRLALDAGGAT
jgi:hypothetical protein